MPPMSPRPWRFDGAVSVAQDCVQVLGGIGFTFEHDAHLYLRRAVALSVAVAAMTGGGEQSAARLARRAGSGQRRAPEIDFDGADAEFRETTAPEMTRIAALPADEQRAALAHAGYLMPHWPRPYGLDAGPVEQLVVDEELARAGLDRPDMAIGGWAVPTIVGHGTEEQAERFVLPTLLGELFWCQLFSEPGAGSDLASLSTRAVRTEGGWRLTGQKVWTSRAHEADWGICLARTDRDAAPHQRHHLLPGRHDVGRHRRPAAAGDDRRRDVQRGLPRRGVRARRLRRGRGQRWLEARPHDAGERAGGDGRQARG